MVTRFDMFHADVLCAFMFFMYFYVFLESKKHENLYGTFGGVGGGDTLKGQEWIAMVKLVFTPQEKLRQCREEKEDLEQRCKRLMQSIAAAAEVSQLGCSLGDPGVARVVDGKLEREEKRRATGGKEPSSFILPPQFPLCPTIRLWVSEDASVAD